MGRGSETGWMKPDRNRGNYAELTIWKNHNKTWMYMNIVDFLRLSQILSIYSNNLFLYNKMYTFFHVFYNGWGHLYRNTPCNNSLYRLHKHCIIMWHWVNLCFFWSWFCYISQVACIVIMPEILHSPQAELWQKASLAI